MAKRKQQDRPNTSFMVHPPVVALLFIIVAYVLGRFIPLPFVMPSILRYTGIALAVIGVLLGISSFLEFQKARTTLDPHGSTTQIVTSGVYRFTRNPIYLGFLFVIIGLPLYLGFIWGFFVAPLYIFLMNHLVIQHEEAYLERKFGDLYTRYTSRVRRWV